MRRKPQLRGRAARLARLIPMTAGPGQAARAPFVLLVVLLLGGGLIGLLVLNSAVSEGSFKLGDLKKETKNLTDEEQALQRDIDAYSAPDALQRRARELGMVPGGDPAFLDPDGTVKGVPSPASGAQQASVRFPLVLAPEALGTAAHPKQATVPAPTAALTAPESVPPARTARPAGATPTSWTSTTAPTSRSFTARTQPQAQTATPTPGR
ncbi:septum formation initiator family protein [Streptomyces sp. NPDC050287]|uniref:septum formation initiator family protein n=1 Tax=Streptomyces sp. NPDC050287 TaxID=3365608 RepID=UPI0037915DA0